MLGCKNLSLSYKDGGKENIVLSNVNLNIKKGENIVLLGPSGSGKSSLVYLLSGLRKPTSGSVYYDGAQIGNVGDNQLAYLRKNKFGFVFQMHFLIPYLSVLENVLLGAPEFNSNYSDKASKVLKELGIGSYEHKKMHQLSGGERQRVAIARALVGEPDIIFADEPTASLDHSNAVEIIKILEAYKENSTLVMATHDTSILSGSERIIRIENKNIKESKLEINRLVDEAS